MITKEQAAQLRRMIEAYKFAHEVDSWKGGGDPEDVPAIEKRLKEADARLYQFIKSITEGGK